MDSVNTFDQPRKVKPTAFSGARVNGDQVSVSLPAKSIVVLSESAP